MAELWLPGTCTTSEKLYFAWELAPSDTAAHLVEGRPRTGTARLRGSLKRSSRSPLAYNAAGLTLQSLSVFEGALWCRLP